MKSLLIVFVPIFAILLNPLGISEFNLFPDHNGDLTKHTSLKSHSLPSELIFCGIFPLNKDDPDRGVPRRDAFLIAIDEINNQTGEDRILPTDVTIKPVFYNDNNNGSGAVFAANQCINSNASIVIGASASNPSANVAFQLTPHEIAQISYASTAPWLSNRTLFPYFMRTVEADPDLSKVVNELISVFYWKTGSIIYPDGFSNFNTEVGIAEHFINTTNINIKAIETFEEGGTNFTEQINSVRESNPEIVFVFSKDPDSVEIFKEAYRQKLTNRNDIAWILASRDHPGSIFTSNDAILKEAKQNILQISPPDFKGPEYGKLRNIWNTVVKCGLNLDEGPIKPCGTPWFNGTGINMETYTPVVYDTVYIAAKGFSLAAEANPDFTGNDVHFLLENLYKVTHEGAGGNYHFDENGEVEGPYHVLNLNDDIYTLVATWDGNLTFRSDTIKLPGDVEWEVSNNLLYCATNCPNTINNNYIIFIVLLLVTLFFGGLLYLKKYRNNYNFKKWIESNQLTQLRKFHQKIIIGLENTRTNLLYEESTFPKIDPISQNTNLYTVVGNIFPPDYRNEIQSSIRGRTVLILIEFAYQTLENSHPTYIAKSLNLPRTSVFNEIKQLIKLEYIQVTISPKTLVDSRYKFYSLTPKGIVFLYLLKETLNIAIMQMQKRD